jgi:hypothetical protein
VYTVDSELVISQYIPFSKIKVVSYENSVRPSQLYKCLEEKLRELKLEVTVLCALFCLLLSLLSYYVYICNGLSPHPSCSMCQIWRQK